VWEERVDETRIITTEGLTTCLDPGRGWAITSGAWNFLKKQECWEGHEQALIKTIRKETIRTEELEEAGYRSPTWAVLQALQQISSGWTITSEARNFLKKQECWEGHEQALTKTIRKETIRTEELEEAGYRSPTWAVLRALQQISSATRIEGEAAMSAPPFFQSAGRGDLFFSGGGEGPIAVIWESLSEHEKKSWLEESSTMHNWVAWCKSKRGAGNPLI